MKKLYLLTLVCILSATAYSQTLLFGGANGNGDFENGNTDWVFVNGSQPNKWIVSNGATAGFTGSSCIYISNDGSTHQYTTNSAAYSYFYKDVAIPAGAKSLWLIYDYISNGESDTSAFGIEALDALRIWSRNTNTQIIPGEELDNVFISAAAGFYGRSTWKKKQVTPISVGAFAGSSMRLIFQWFNNGSNGHQPPAALDNIEFYAGCQDYIGPYTDVDITATSATVVWNTVAGASGYHLRYKKMSEPNSAPTYTNPILIPGGNTYFYNLGNLAPGTDYVAEISPVGVACTEYSSPAFFSTLTPPANDVCSGATLLPVWSSAQPGNPASFRASTPTTGLTSICANGNNNDVWFRFVAQQAQQYIQTSAKDYQSSFYSATNITLFSGDCDNLQPVSLPCATQSLSFYQGGLISRLIATGLTVGNTYYIRVNTNNNSGYDDFNIGIYNPIPAPDCPDLLQPVNDSVVNYGIPYTFKWTKANGADAYRLRIFEESGAYTEVHTRDTSFVFTAVPGINYTWLATPYNVLDIGNGCTAATFSACPLLANPITISAIDTDKCLHDSIKITASAPGSYQWFLNNHPVTGATADSIWAKQAGNYTLRIRDGNCYSSASNVITITNKATPVKPILNPTGTVTICEGSSQQLNASFSLNNQWYKNNSLIAGANGNNFITGEEGHYFLRVTNASSGCHNYSDTVNILVTPLPATPTITPLSAVNFCDGDSVQLKSSVANGNRWYRDGVLIAGATDSIYVAHVSGSYSLRTAANNCVSLESAATTVTVTVAPATPPVVSSTGSLTFCLGDNTAQLTSSVANNNLWFRNGVVINGATGASYTPAESGDYTVKTNLNGCHSAASNSIAVLVNPLPAKPVITPNGYTLTTVAGASSYTWYLNGSLIPGSNTNQHIVLIAGTYKVLVSDANGCKNTSEDFNAVVTGTNDVNVLGYQISMFPNPVTDYVSINVAAGNGISRKFTATISDLHGRVIMTQALRDGINRLPLASFAQGQYFLTLRSGSTVKTIKLMKSK